MEQIENKKGLFRNRGGMHLNLNPLLTYMQECFISGDVIPARTADTLGSMREAGHSIQLKEVLISQDLVVCVI